jgi:hypothetical protein
MLITWGGVVLAVGSLAHVCAMRPVEFRNSYDKSKHAPDCVQPVSRPVALNGSQGRDCDVGPIEAAETQ